jgi:hypothetical protein
LKRDPLLAKRFAITDKFGRQYFFHWFLVSKCVSSPVDKALAASALLLIEGACNKGN